MIDIQDSSLTLRHHLLNYIKTNERAIHDKHRLNNYSSETGAMFSIGHSVKLKHTSEVVYRTVVFYCCHGGKIRNRSNGIRPRQHHLCLQCSVKTRLQSNGTTLKVTVINLNHNHKVDQSNLKFYTHQRRLDNDTIELIKKYNNQKFLEYYS
ncbi:unnamed protein product [Didymodactylos carnosus]|uniref:FAR1 domain-containing protein n=1 Tax=Didymodactylos carnosus TaxID=1234261 RepID=A0A815LUL8_9BILA|nr:unnamed protein product [Didymodactylos carnosus]CAF1408945.1 unnamed protein product [Didymodactylos carnosus]CAF3613693.1 unnamed protein product [Didymodactylos carnosus]CAF4298691.1 unnamed protein product [Didymodactylos carnosus]